MSPPSPPPTYLYKIVPSDSPLPSPLPQKLPTSPLDLKDGFIHLSTSSQLLTTLSLFFASASSVYILRIPYSRVEKFINWETSPGEQKDGQWQWTSEDGKKAYPHIYSNGDEEGQCGKGIKLGKEEVENVGLWKKGAEGWTVEDWPFGHEDIPQ